MTAMTTASPMVVDDHIATILYAIRDGDVDVMSKCLECIECINRASNDVRVLLMRLRHFAGIVGDIDGPCARELAQRERGMQLVSPVPSRPHAMLEAELVWQDAARILRKAPEMATVLMHDDVLMRAWRHLIGFCRPWKTLWCTFGPRPDTLQYCQGADNIHSFASFYIAEPALWYSFGTFSPRCNVASWVTMSSSRTLTPNPRTTPPVSGSMRCGTTLYSINYRGSSKAFTMVAGNLAALLACGAVSRSVVEDIAETHERFEADVVILQAFARAKVARLRTLHNPNHPLGRVVIQRRLQAELAEDLREMLAMAHHSD